jgi:hypothetical protein
MESTQVYCPVRKGFEERTWFLTSLHCTLTARLLSLIGSEHEEFLATLDCCEMTAQNITESRVGLLEHRRNHCC